MTYFLKKKKWMAWVVLLTFLFTSFMPTNLLAGNSVAEAKISGPTTVAVGETITLTSDKGFLNHSWSSNKSKVATVSGDVTITHTYGRQQSESYEITVIPAGTVAANFYYLKTPTSDPASNDTNQWGEKIDGGAINIAGAKWDSNNKNSYDDVKNRVVSWPSGFTNGVVPNGTHWDNIFEAFKASVEEELGDTITIDDVESITLIPYKISNNDDGYHVDCTVKIKVKNIYTATYYLWDAGDTGYQWKYAENVKAGGTTSPGGKVSNLLETKVVDGKTYYLISWYDNTGLTGGKATFPYTPTNNVNFYAKYVEKYFVSYDLAGGTGNAPAKTLYAVDDMVNVTNVVPTKQGYTFAGWTTNDVTVNGGSFTMPAKDVVLTAQWTPKEDTEYKVRYFYEGNDGEFAELATRPAMTRQGTTDAEARVIDAVDKIPNNNTHYFDAENENSVLSGTIAADGSLVLKVYFKKKTPITITAGDNSKTYDGTALTQPVYSVTHNGNTGDAQRSNIPAQNAQYTCTLSNGDVVYASTIGSITNAGTTSNLIDSAKDKKPKVLRNGVDVTEQYKITCEEGVLEVTKRPITLSSESGSKEYDGTALTKPEVTQTGEFVTGEGFVKDSLQATGSVLYAGEKATNTIVYELADGTKATNYTITKQEGALEIKDRTEKYVLKLTAKGDSKPYNGATQSVTGYDENWNGLSGYTISGVSAGASGKDAATYATSFSGLETAVIKDASGKDVTSQFKVETEDSNLVITPIAITLSSESGSKVYDGTALKNDTVTVGGDGFVEGEGAIYDVTGAQTNVGSSDNTFTYELIEGTKADNYEITVEFGTLTVTRNEGAPYQVAYHYQNPQTGEYELFAISELRSTTAGSLAFIEQEDTVTTRSMYQFNAEKTETQKTVHIYPNDEQGNPQYTTLNVYFDALYNVVYRYTDGETSYDVARSGYVYHYGDSVVAPGMASVDQFDGRWYKNADGNTDEWVFDDETIEKNIGLVNADNTIYLYTTAKVTPLNDNTIKISKKAVNGTEGAAYGFNLKLIVDPKFETDPLTKKAAEKLHGYNAAMITAKGQYDSAKGALDRARAAFMNGVIATTQSAYTFIMYGPEVEDINGNEILPALYSITTGSAYEFRGYNLFEDSFDVRNGASTVGEGVMLQIADFIESMVNWRTPIETLDPESTLEGLNFSGINTSGSALAFDFDDANNLFLAAKDLVGKEKTYEDAKAALENYMTEVGRYAVVTVTVDGESTKYVLNGTDEAGNKLFTPDESGKYILSFDFELTSGAFKDFKVTATTGSTIQFIITETDDGGAVSTTVNGSTGHSVTGMMTTGSALEYTFVNNFNSGDGEDPWTPTDPEDPRDPQDPIDIEDPDVPLAEPDVDEPDIEIEDPDVPLTDVPGDLVEIDEPEVPLGDAPRTGDSSNAIPFVVLMMGAGIGLAITRRKFN